MSELHVRSRVGIDYLEAVTTLLQRARRSHPTKGLFEAADLQWWWRTQRTTDETGQLFWFDDHGRPEAAVILTDWRSRVALDPIFMPDASPDLVAHVVERGLAHVHELGFETIELEVAEDDDVLRQVLFGHGFTVIEHGLIVESWLDAAARPAVSELPGDYRLTTRQEAMDLPLHNGRSGPQASERLLQTSLYRTDLDLLVVDTGGNPAAYGVFWHDPTTATGLVEPMRTEDDHQQRGLARHVLTAGIERLVRAGAERIKICYEPDNPASGHLYRSVGFVPVKQTDALSGPVTASTS